MFAPPLPEMPVDQPAIVQSASALLAAKARLSLSHRINAHIGVLYATRDAPNIALFQNAIEELGGQVSVACPSLDNPDSRKTEEMVRLLGRLYTALECVDLDPTFVNYIRTVACIPAFEGLSTEKHWVACAVTQVSGNDSIQAKRQALIQAYLLAMMPRQGR